MIRRIINIGKKIRILQITENITEKKLNWIRLGLIAKKLRIREDVDLRSNKTYLLVLRVS